MLTTKLAEYDEVVWNLNKQIKESNEWLAQIDVSKQSREDQLEKYK